MGSFGRRPHTDSLPVSPMRPCDFRLKRRTRTSSLQEESLARGEVPVIFLAHGRRDTMMWLADVGEMGPLVQRTNWSATGLGALETWPASRKTAVGICLRSSLPSALFLGP